MQAAERAEKWQFFVPGDLDLQTHPSVNMMQIHSAAPKIFHTNKKKLRLMAPKTEPSAVRCVR